MKILHWRKKVLGNDGAVLDEVEDLVPTKGSAPSCDDSVPCETKVHADRKGSPSVKAGTTTTELIEVIDAVIIAVTAINSSATAEDHQPQTSSSSDAANLWPAKTDIKVRSEPGVAAEKDTPSGTNTPSKLNLMIFHIRASKSTVQWNLVVNTVFGTMEISLYQESLLYQVKDQKNIKSWN